MKILKKNSLLISISIAVFTALGVSAFSFGAEIFSHLFENIQLREEWLLWWRVGLLTAFAAVYGVFVQKVPSKRVFLDSVMFLMGWIFLGLISAWFFGIDLIVISVVLTVVISFCVIRVKNLMEVDIEVTERIKELTSAGDLLENRDGDFRIESGLKLLETVLPLSEVIVFRCESNGDLNPVGRTRNGTGIETHSSRQASWQENVELCEKALESCETIIKIDKENVGAARIALPLLADNKVVGGLFIDIRQNFERNDQHLLEAFSEQLARNFQRSELLSKKANTSLLSSFSTETLRNRLDMLGLIDGVIKEQSFGSLATSYLKEAHVIAYLDGTIAYMNKQMRHLAEIKPTEIHDVNLFGLLDKFKTEVFNEPSIAIRRVLQTGKTYQCELERSETKTTLDLQITLVKMPDDSHALDTTDMVKKPACFLITFSDISAVKENEKLRSDVAHLMSHELRTPITSIQGFAELLMVDENMPPDAQEYLAIIAAESKRASNLLTNFLSVANLQQKDKQKIDTSPVKMDTVVSEVVENLKGAAKKKRIRLVQKPEKFIPPIAADRGLIASAISHLIDNAVKYSPERSAVIISTILDADFLRVEVEDRGYGIAPEEREKIWQKFYRIARKGQDKEEDSTGLGLALVKEIIAQHKGDINLQSEVGRGSKFSIRLPRL